ncbi:GyrI-like domain-containing protein [Poseidonibacter sp.]|uniref:GyrI-like domain-containing protein n=1 Tax=Poseidonibacter sp. TaxID=2321188 RepID=UPI003C73992D
MKTHRIKKLIISGISTVTNNETEINSGSPKLPNLWGEYDEKNIYSATFNKVNESAMYGVYTEYASDLTGDYKYTVGVEVKKGKDVITIENERFLVFRAKGDISETVLETWEKIWAYFADENSEYKRKYSVDFEKYVAEEEIEIYISIID